MAIIDKPGWWDLSLSETEDIRHWRLFEYNSKGELSFWVPTLANSDRITLVKSASGGTSKTFYGLISPADVNPHYLIAVTRERGSAVIQTEETQQTSKEISLFSSIKGKF